MTRPGEITNLVAVNFGCGLDGPPGWRNYDASPTLRLQRVPFFGRVLERFIEPRFLRSARYGDVVRGLREPGASVDLVYCSHVLEHLALADFRRALVEVFRILKPHGVFRGVLPDLRAHVETYLSDSSDDACSRFLEETGLGLADRPRGPTGTLRALLGNSQHLWMWDFAGLRAELIHAGFESVRRATFGDSARPEFAYVENASRWNGCLGFECEKPERR